MLTLKPKEAARRLVSHLGLARPLGRGRPGVQAVLERLRSIQLDPLDVIGTNADLVVMARVDEVSRGDLWRHLFPRHAFEHFAKERCILPAAAFPEYRAQGHKAETPWWRHGERERRLTPETIAAVLDEVRQRGPINPRDLEDHGVVEPMDWSGWRSTSKATSMALEVLWTRCEVVVSGRTSSGAKLYDVPERALGGVASLPAGEDFNRWALLERARATGLLSRASGAMWSMLREVRSSGIIDRLVEQGELVEVGIEGSTRRYVALPEFFSRRQSPFDDRVRILGPLDPLLWDRDLVRLIFGFDYVWEVYKPAHLRQWGWYVCPLLFRDRLVGRIDAVIEEGTLLVRKLWIEGEVEEGVVDEALERHALACGATKVKIRKVVR